MLDSYAQSAILSTIYPQWRIQELTNIGGGGDDFFKNLDTPQPASYAPEGSGGMLPRRKFFNLRPQMKCSGSYFGLFFLTYSHEKKAPRIIWLYIDVEFNKKM